VLPQPTSTPLPQLTALSPLTFTEFTYTPLTATSTQIRASGHAKRTIYFSFALQADTARGVVQSLSLQLPAWSLRELGQLKKRCEEEGNIQLFLRCVGEYASLCMSRHQAMDKVRRRYKPLCSRKGGMGERVLRLRKGEAEVTVFWGVEVSDTGGAGSRARAEVRVPRGWKRGLEGREARINGLFVNLVDKRGWAEAVGCLVELIFPGEKEFVV
jgi:hypothetical protein